MPNEKLKRLLEYFNGPGKAAKALGVTERTLLNIRQGKVKLRKPHKIMLEYFNNDPEQFREVCNAVAEGRPADWAGFTRRVLAERLGRLTDRALADDKDDGTDIKV